MGNKSNYKTSNYVSLGENKLKTKKKQAVGGNLSPQNLGWFLLGFPV